MCSTINICFSNTENANSLSLDLIENSLLVLCLDDGTPNVPSYTTIRKEATTLECATMAAHLLHGSGTDAGSANRWYDKFLQVSKMCMKNQYMVLDNAFQKCQSESMTFSNVLNWINSSPAICKSLSCLSVQSAFLMGFHQRLTAGAVTRRSLCPVAPVLLTTSSHYCVLFITSACSITFGSEVTPYG